MRPLSSTLEVPRPACYRGCAVAVWLTGPVREATCRAQSTDAQMQALCACTHYAMLHGAADMLIHTRGSAAAPAAAALSLPLRRWCGHCRQLAPKWKQVAASLKGVAKVAAVNCDQHKSLCSTHGVRGYPTIKTRRPGSKELQEYNGDRGAKALSDYVLYMLPNHVVTVNNDAALDKLLSTCSGSKGAARAK